MGAPNTGGVGQIDVFRSNI